MAHVANVLVKNTWEDLETLISAKTGSTFSFDSSKNYYLVTSSGSTVYCVNQAAQPEAAAPIGVPVGVMEQCGLKLASGKVFVSTESGTANLHVEVEG